MYWDDIEVHRGVCVCSIEFGEIPPVEIFTTGRDLAAVASPRIES
jgi:hypothetical protein